MITEPLVGMRVRILKENCCYAVNNAGDVGTIVSIIGPDDFSVQLENGRETLDCWWHSRKCVERVDEYILGSQLEKVFSETNEKNEFIKVLKNWSVYGKYTEEQLRIIWYALNDVYCDAIKPNKSVILLGDKMPTINHESTTEAPPPLDMVLENLDPDPNEVIKLFSKLINLSNPREANVLRRLQKEYADNFGITIYQ